MKKIISIIIILSVLLTSCARDNTNTEKTVTVTVTNTVTVTQNNEPKDNEENSIYTSLANEGPNEAVLLIVNGADNFNYDNVSLLQTVSIEGVTSTSESMVLVPRYLDSIVSIEAIEYNIETEDFDVKHEIFNSGVTPDGYAIRFNAFRPEGAPINRILITYNNETTEYLVSYNGKDGNPTIEYVD